MTATAATGLLSESDARKNILVLGGTGGTGRQVITQALEQGHEVTAFVRNPEKLGISSDRLRVVKGDVTDDGPSLTEAMRDQDAVISALGRGMSLKSFGLVTRATPIIIAAMQTMGVRRLIFTSAYGVGATRIDTPLLPRIISRVLLHDLYADKEAGEEELRRSALDWTLVYPGTLTNGPLTERYRVGERLELRGLPLISRADVAHFLLTQVSDTAYVRKGVLVC